MESDASWDRRGPGVEGRRERRVEITLRVRVRDAGGGAEGEYVPALIGDVSGAGIKLLIKAERPPYALLQVEFDFPRDGLVMRVAARLRWHRRLGGSARVAGYEFLPITPALREQLLGAVERELDPSPLRRTSAPTPRVWRPGAGVGAVGPRPAAGGA